MSRLNKQIANSRAADSWFQCGPSAGSHTHQLSTSAEFHLLCNTGDNLWGSDPADIVDWADSGDINWFGE